MVRAYVLVLTKADLVRVPLLDEYSVFLDTIDTRCVWEYTHGYSVFAAHSRIIGKVGTPVKGNFITQIDTNSSIRSGTTIICHLIWPKQYYLMVNMVITY